MSPIKVLLDGRSVGQRIDGIGRYVREIGIRFGHVDDVIIKILCRSDIDTPFSSTCRVDTTMRYDRHPWTEIWNHLVLPGIIKRSQIDIYHSPAFYSLPISPHFKQIVTIHDLGVFHNPQWFPSRFRWLIRRAVRKAIVRAESIVVDSDAVRDELETRWPDVAEKISVIKLAADERFSCYVSEQDRNRIRSKHGLRDPYFLNIGTLEPRKNVPLLLAAYNILGQKIANCPELVIAGAYGWGPDPRPCIKKSGAVYIGSPDDEDLPALYSMALGFVYPSSYEGFGLPLLEAMSCGVPTITGMDPACLEVTGGAALTLPLNEESLFVAMRSLIDNPELGSQLSKAGLTRSKEYCWNRTLNQLINHYITVGNR